VSTPRGGQGMWGSEQELDAAERRIKDWQARIDKRAAHAAALSRRIAELTASARSKDGLIEVTVASSGVITHLRLDERIRNQSAAHTSQQILAVMDQAQASLIDRVTEATAETIGLDDPAGRAIVDGFAGRFGRSDEDETRVGR
jgi:DNA-binding protein YbaB